MKWYQKIYLLLLKITKNHNTDLPESTCEYYGDFYYPISKTDMQILRYTLFTGDEVFIKYKYHYVRITQDVYGRWWADDTSYYLHRNEPLDKASQ